MEIKVMSRRWDFGAYVKLMAFPKCLQQMVHGEYVNVRHASETILPYP